MSLSERYRPTTLSDVCGQPGLRPLHGLLVRPAKSCWLFRGETGNGKTSAAKAIAHDLGADDFSTHLVKAADLTTDRARELEYTLRLKPMGGQWSVLIIEELERLHPNTMGLLQTFLCSELPDHLIVIATTNDDSGLRRAFRTRFKPVDFGSSAEFAKAANLRLRAVWTAECGNEPMPAGWERWGYAESDEGQRKYSMRVAYDQMEMELLARLAGVAA